MEFAGWSIEPPLAYVAVAGLLYWLGGRRMKSPQRPIRTACFCAGLASIVIALDSPLDGAADKLFWAHMVQHVVLLTVSPPLILFGRPWPRMWRALPLGFRKKVGRGLVQSGVAAPLRALARPLPAFILFNASIVLWHIPSLYNATLESNAIHQTEHAIFFFSGLLFWARVIDPGPLRPRLEWPMRIAYVTGAMVVGFAIGLTLVMAPHPLIAHYAGLAHRPGGLTALDDQQIAGGVMWVPGSISYTIAALIAFYRWLEPEAPAPVVAMNGAGSPRPSPEPVAPDAPRPRPVGAEEAEGRSPSTHPMLTT
jgi:cytochrome c oxidase assembly factor CtaG